MKPTFTTPDVFIKIAPLIKLQLTYQLGKENDNWGKGEINLLTALKTKNKIYKGVIHVR